MAHKAESFKVEARETRKGKKYNAIILYTNVEPNSAEQMLIDRYLNMGYEPMFEEKKFAPKVEDMRAELGKYDKENGTKILDEFNNAYGEKGKGDFKETGFAKACKIYNDWKKEQKEKKNSPADSNEE